jgi:hypothetical protein
MALELLPSLISSISLSTSISPHMHQSQPPHAPPNLIYPSPRPRPYSTAGVVKGLQMSPGSSGNKMPFMHAVRVNGVQLIDESKSEGKYAQHIYSTTGFQLVRVPRQTRDIIAACSALLYVVDGFGVWC